MENDEFRADKFAWEEGDVIFTPPAEKTLQEKLFLSKSLYCTGLGCPRALWLQKNHPELAEASGDTTPMENGIAVGSLARGLFDPSVTVEFRPDKAAMAEETERLIRRGESVICEASFLHGGLYCAVDLLRNMGGNRVAIYEVKAENHLKPINYEDLYFQVHVLQCCGYEVVSANLVHLNKEYVRHGDIDLQELFIIEDVTARALAEADMSVGNNLVVLGSVLTSGREPFEGDLPDCCAADACPFWNHCSAHLPQPNVFSLNGTGYNIDKKRESYRSGIVSYEDLLKDPSLPERQRLQVEAELTGETRTDPAGILQTLDRLSYPLYFLDFETYSVPIPPYDNISPYLQVPFQYSLHYIAEEGGELMHTEYLAEPGTDSRRELAEQLCRDIPENVCTTAYHASFEKSVIRKLAELFPDLAEHLMNIHDRVEDLEIPFKNQYYITPEMQGRSTIKLVLPALYPDDPELDYHNLEGVHMGTEANAAFLAMADMTAEERAVTRQQLLKYCGLDTYAMVKVWQKLKEAAEDSIH